MRWLLLLVTFSLYAQVELHPVSGEPHRAGDSVDVVVKLKDSTLFDSLPPQALQKSSIEKSLWFLRVDPWSRTDGAFETQGRVVLGPKLDTTVPQKLVVGGQEVEVRFVGWNFDSSAEKGVPPLEYENTEWFSRAWWRKNAIPLAVCALALLGVLAVVIPPWIQKRKARRERVAARETWLKNLEATSDLASLSQLWMQRDQLLAVWPDKTEEIHRFFGELNQYQFNPHVQPEELKSVWLQKETLLTGMRGGLHGV